MKIISLYFSYPLIGYWAQEFSLKSKVPFTLVTDEQSLPGKTTQRNWKSDKKRWRTVFSPKELSLCLLLATCYRVGDFIVPIAPGPHCPKHLRNRSEQKLGPIFKQLILLRERKKETKHDQLKSNVQNGTLRKSPHVPLEIWWDSSYPYTSNLIQNIYHLFFTSLKTKALRIIINFQVYIRKRLNSLLSTFFNEKKK